MKIVIVNGRHEADYIVKMFNKNKNNLVVINSDKLTCEYISLENKIDVYHGDPTKEYVLQETNIYNADVFIALSSIDADNYVACLLAKRVFNVKKCICIVVNPKNVNLYKNLGIDSVISSTYLLAETIKNESSVDKMIKTLSIEDEKIIITRIEVEKDFYIAGKTLMDIGFPKNASISCIYRNPHVIIPNGTTIINPNDKLVIISTPIEQENIINYVQRKRVDE